MEQQYFLGVDIGTTAIKAALFDGCGQKLLHRTQEYELLKPSAQRVEQAPHVYWDTFCACVKYVVQNSGVDPRHIKAFSMDSSAETIAFMDENLEPLDNFYVWLDSRAEEEANEINEHFPAARSYMPPARPPLTRCTRPPRFSGSKTQAGTVPAHPHDVHVRRLHFVKMSGRMVSHGSSWCTSYLWTSPANSGGLKC